MRVELSRFRVKEGKSDRVNAWLKMLNDQMSKVIQTLDREQMKLEIIFREMINGTDYLYWFSVQGENPECVETSPFEVDARQGKEDANSNRHKIPVFHGCNSTSAFSVNLCRP